MIETRCKVRVSQHKESMKIEGLCPENRDGGEEVGCSALSSMRIKLQDERQRQEQVEGGAGASQGGAAREHKRPLGCS